MSDFWGAGAATQAMAEFLGTMMTNDANNKVNRDNIAWQAKSMQASMDFQKYMRATAYQATMQDMKAAGLNPILAADRGATGSGPVSIAPGSSVAMQNPHAGNAFGEGMRAFSGAALAREQARTQDTVRQANLSQATLNDANSVRAAAETSLLNARTRSEGGVPAVQQATISQLVASARERLAQIPVAEATAAAGRQGVVQRNEFGHGHLADSVSALTALVGRLRGMIGNSARPSGVTGNPMGE